METRGLRGVGAEAVFVLDTLASHEFQQHLQTGTHNATGVWRRRFGERFLCHCVYAKRETEADITLAPPDTPERLLIGK